MSVVAVLSVVASSTGGAEAAPPVPRGTRSVAVTRGGRTIQTTTFEVVPAPDGRPMRAGSLVVRYGRGTDGPHREAARRDAPADEVEPLGDDQERLHVDPRHTQDAMSRLRSRPEVASVEPEYVARAVAQPNDPRFAEQWGMARIGAPAAWDSSHGVRADGTRVKIAVLDCGVYDEASGYPAPDGGAGHPDLRGKVVARQNFTFTADTDDFCNHGTHIAGIAAARTDDAIGVAGVGYEAQILNGKVLDDTATGTSTWISQGIVWASQNGASVINMSLAAVGACPLNVQQAINTAWAAGVVVVAAAGNDGLAAVSWPANCANVVAVAATDGLDHRASFSNYGVGVDVAAPGVDVLSTDYTGGYWSFSGTSQASAHVAGLAALVWASPQGTSADAVVHRLTDTADRVGGEGTFWQFGRVNALAALTAVVPPATPPLAPSGLTATALSGRQVRLTWTDRSADETGFKVERRRGSGAWSQIATPARNATTYTDSGLVSGAQYTYRVRSYNAAGNSSFVTSSQVTARS